MNIKFITLAVASSIAFPVSAATVYKDSNTDFEIGGRVEGRANFSDANKIETDDNGDIIGNDNSTYEDMSRVRLNVQGKQKYNDNIAFVGRYEFELKEQNNGDVDINTRHLYVGTETNMGNLYYGHQNNAVTYLTDWTDQAETYSGYTNEYTVASADRAKNVIRYAITTPEGITFQADGNFSNDKNSTGYGIALAYEVNNLGVGVGYSASDQTYSWYNNIKRISYINPSQKHDSDTYYLTAKYSFDGFYGAAMYQGGKIADSDFYAIDAFASYTFGDNMVDISYNKYSADDYNFLDIEFIGIEYARYMGNFAAYVSYKFDLVDAVPDVAYLGDNTDDELMLGVRYSF
ncbi:porin [Photobacterium damselae subsp. damselae]|uniref:porin n=1 Tax=Photobacterium damselae TaxID=38293 RepID=UPI00311B2A88